MRKMRLIAEAYQEIVQQDPNTALTKSAFRRLVLEDRIPSVSIGNRRLVSMEDVEDFFRNGTSEDTKTGKIRSVNL